MFDVDGTLWFVPICNNPVLVPRQWALEVQNWGYPGVGLGDTYVDGAVEGSFDPFKDLEGYVETSQSQISVSDMMPPTASPRTTCLQR